MIPLFNTIRRNGVRPLKTTAGGTIVDPGDVTPAASGEAMPNTDLPGWKLSWSQDFLTPCTEGSFLNVYGGTTYDAATAVNNGRLNAYPVGYNDTRSKTAIAKGEPATNWGHYNPGIISAQDSIMKVHFQTVGGQAQVACPIPKISGVGKWGAVPGGRFAVRIKADPMIHRKLALLTWPYVGTNTKGATAGTQDSLGNYIGGNGEIDFLEQNLLNDTFAWFMHWQNGTDGNDQNGATHATDSVTDGAWHTVVLEWVMGVSCRVLIDGVQLGPLRTGAKVPATPMVWKLQMETFLYSQTSLIDLTANGYVYIDWLAYWSSV